MAASKRFAIPSLSQMENEDYDIDKGKGSLFKRHKSSTDADTGSSTESTSNSGAIKGKESNGNAVTDASSTSRENYLQRSSSSSTRELPPVSSHAVSVSTSSDLGKSSHSNSSNNTNEASTDSAKSSTTSKPGSSNSLIVNPRQRGNPILKSVRNVPWEYGNIMADYVMGPTNCALFLSLRYHQLHPNYIHDRLKNLGKSFELRVMLVQVDVKEPHHLLKDLAKICLLADCTLILAFSAEEAGKYLETYKVFENKPAEAIMEKTEDNFMAKFVDCLTRVKSVNKTDCATLLTAFGSLSNIMEAKEDELCLCPGFGPQKAKRLRSIFQEPFLRSQPKASESSAQGT